MNKTDIEALFTEQAITEAEIKFILDADTAVTANMNQSRVTADLLLAKSIAASTQKIIDSNDKIAKSNEENSTAMIRLTKGLVIVGVVQIIASIGLAISSFN